MVDRIDKPSSSPPPPVSGDAIGQSAAGPVVIDGFEPADEVGGPRYFEQNFNGVSFDRWQRFYAVPSDLRTWLTNQMMEVKNTFAFLTDLQAEDINEGMKAALSETVERLETIVHDLQSPLFENGSLSLLGLERLQNLLFRVGHGSMLRVNINMTDANKLDPSGRLGTAYKNVVLMWLQREFGIRHVSQNPEGTSFLAINVGPHEISCSLRRYAHEIKLMLQTKDVQKQYAFDPNLLKRFTPDATSMFMTLSTMGLEVDEILKSGNRQMVLDLQNQLITYIEESQRLLAVGTTLAEKEGPEKFGLTAIYGGLNVFDASDLPMFPEMQGYDRLQMGLRIGIGYVPTAEYRSPMDERITFQVAPGKLAFHPRYAHNYGLLYELAMTKFKTAVGEVQKASTRDEIEDSLVKLRESVEWLTIIFTIGEVARANARNHLFTKWIQPINLHDGTKKLEYYFLEDVAMMPEPNVNIVVAEIDSFKAFSNAYPVDETDSNFWNIFDQFVWVAKARDIDTPIMTQVGGDLIAVAIPTVDKHGKPVDPSEFMARVQKRMAGVYSNKPFQDYAKIEVSNGHGNRVERWPLWRVGDKIIPSMTQPAGGEPYRRTLSLTMVGTTVSTPRSALDISPFFDMITDLAVRVDELKNVSAPQKGQFRVISYEQLAMPIQQPQIMGFYVPLETRQQGEELKSFVDAAERQLASVWGAPWKALPVEVRRNFIVRLSSFFTPQTQPVLTPAVIEAIFSQMNLAVPILPIAPVILAPCLPSILPH
jgi:hypothetical protein